jgi:hypothetical protein
MFAEAGGGDGWRGESGALGVFEEEPSGELAVEEIEIGEQPRPVVFPERLCAL